MLNIEEIEMDEFLGEVMSAEAVRAALKADAWNGVAAYILWDRAKRRPIYCGTAKSSRRLIGHLDKDDLANRPVGKTHVNPGLRAYCLSQPRGWLGVSFRLFETEAAARAVERSIIAQLGIQKFGGILFNQRLTG